MTVYRNNNKILIKPKEEIVIAKYVNIVDEYLTIVAKEGGLLWWMVAKNRW